MRPSKSPGAKELSILCKSNSRAEIAERYHVSIWTVNRWLKEAGIRKVRTRISKSTRPSKEDLYRDYIIDRLLIREISEKYNGASFNAIHNWIREYGIPNRGHREIPKPEKEILRKLYLEDDFTLEKLADMFHVSPFTMHKWIASYGLNIKQKLKHEEEP